MRTTLTSEYLDEQSNRYTIRCMIITTLILLALWILNLLNIFIVEQRLFVNAVCCNVVIMAVMLTVTRIFGIKKPGIKYAVLTTAVIIHCMMYVSLTYHVVLGLIFPLIYSAQYRRKRVLWYTYACSVAGLFICVPLGYRYGLCDANMVMYTASTTDSFLLSLPGLSPETGFPWVSLILYYIFPRSMVLLGAVPVLSYITTVMDRQTERLLASQERNLQLNREHQEIQQNVIIALSSAVESKDKTTGDHIKNTTRFVSALTAVMLSEGCFPGQLTEEYAELINKAAPLHDIGKIKVPDAILCKPGKLTEDEFSQIKLHSLYGKQIMREILGDIKSSDYLTIAEQIAVVHHERYDGKGYPYGLSGENIPLCARIMAVADVLDALLSRRPYKEPFSPERAREIMASESGKQFDPTVLGTLLGSWDSIVSLKESSVS